MTTFRKRLGLALALMVSVGLMAPAQANASFGHRSYKISVCHQGEQLQVGLVRAILLVLFRGDTLGSCGGDTPPDDPPDDGSGSGGGF